jgi:hypothetical protein
MQEPSVQLVFPFQNMSDVRFKHVDSPLVLFTMNTTDFLQFGCDSEQQAESLCYNIQRALESYRLLCDDTTVNLREVIQDETENVFIMHPIHHTLTALLTPVAQRQKVVQHSIQDCHQAWKNILDVELKERLALLKERYEQDKKALIDSYHKQLNSIQQVMHMVIDD